jgi:type VI protein secretion system component Hcp
MLSALRRHLTYANVVSSLCLFIVLGGGAYAAVTITGKNVKNNSLTSDDIKNGSLLHQDFKAGQLPKGAQGPQGPQGPAGAAGAKGADAPAPTPPPHSDPVRQRLSIDRGNGLSPLTFDVLSSKWGGSQSGTTGTGGGGGAGKSTFDDLVVVKDPGVEADELFQAATKGTHFDGAKLDLFAPGASSPRVTYDLGGTTVTKFSLNGNGEGRTQQLQLSVSDPQNLPNNPPKATFFPGAPALPLTERKIGEMTSTEFPAGTGTIALYTDSWGVLGAPPAVGGAGAGKTTFEDFAVTKAIDAASPALLKDMKTGAHLARVDIKLLQPGTTNEFATYKLEDMIVNGYHYGGSVSALEQVSFNYAKLTQTIPQPGGGSLTSCYSVKTNAAC